MAQNDCDKQASAGMTTKIKSLRYSYEFCLQKCFLIFPFLCSVYSNAQIQLLKGNYRIPIHSITCRATNAVDIDAILAVNTQHKFTLVMCLTFQISQNKQSINFECQLTT